MRPFPNYRQPDYKDCGPACLKIIAKYHGKMLSLQKIRDLSHTTRIGSSLFHLSEAAEKIGFRATGVRTDYKTLAAEVPFPCILFWENKHFVVAYKLAKGLVYISDPAEGKYRVTKKELLDNWIGGEAGETTQEGLALLLEPTPRFYKTEWEEEEEGHSIKFILKYVFRYKHLLLQLALGLLAGSLLQLLFPFLTQSLVDVGIQNQDINFIYLILLAQLMLFIGSMSIEVIRGWILLHLSTRINISLISDFFIKLMNLPISFFDTRITGDILQRINDHQRIERLLTQTSLNTLFSFFNILVFSMILLFYSSTIFLIFLLGSALYIGWIVLFLKKRKKIDYQQFSHISAEQSKVIELINGMQEIKLHNAEKQKRWSWEFIQIRLYKVAIRALRLNQFQGMGASFIDQFKNIVITITAATLVVRGQITLGMMLSIQYIIGQLNGPLAQIVGFIQSVQDAQIGLERLGEIHRKEDEEPAGAQRATEIDSRQDIIVKNLVFSYPGATEPVLNNIDLTIPRNKVTAIVGPSGSGKTTLMKLLMKFYEPQSGDLLLGHTSFRHISQKSWREECGVVMQEGYIFNDTIANNISVNDHNIDKSRLRRAVEIANIREFIESLPNSYNTVIGNEGVGISTGQKQRILIARAVYKDPSFIFFDEATSALDANNERVIMENLQSFFRGRTAVVIAHRLSTVKNADQIIVVDKRKIVEIGNHRSLTLRKGNYFELVKNQLEL
jgi:ATP-binding cassette subfamily B protein